MKALAQVPLKRVIHEGQVYYRVSNAARILRTSNDKVRELMGAGLLEHTQLKVNGPVVIPSASLLGYQKALVAEGRKADK